MKTKISLILISLLTTSCINGQDNIYPYNFLSILNEASKVLDNFNMESTLQLPDEEYRLNPSKQLTFEVSYWNVDNNIDINELMNTHTTYKYELEIFSPDEGYKLYSAYTHTPSVWPGVYIRDGKYYPAMYVYNENTPIFAGSGELCTVERGGEYAYLCNTRNLRATQKPTPIYGFLYCMMESNITTYDIYAKFREPSGPYSIETICFLPKNDEFQQDCLQDLINANYTEVNFNKLKTELENYIKVNR